MPRHVKFAVGDDVPPEIKTLADACSVHFRTLSRLWMFAATVTLLTAASHPMPCNQSECIRMIGGQFEIKDFYPVSAVLLSLLNIAYCSAHAQAYRVQDILIKLVERYECAQTNFAPQLSIATVAHALYAPALGRLYPLSVDLSMRERLNFDYFQFILHCAFVFCPIIGVLFAMHKSIQNEVGTWTIIALITVFSSSLAATRVLMKWPIDRFKAKHPKASIKALVEELWQALKKLYQYQHK